MTTNDTPPSPIAPQTEASDSKAGRCAVATGWAVFSYSGDIQIDDNGRRYATHPESGLRIYESKLPDQRIAIYRAKLNPDGSIQSSDLIARFPETPNAVVSRDGA